MNYSPLPHSQRPMLTVVLLFLLFAAGVSAQETEQDPITWRAAQRQEAGWYGSPEAIRVAENVLVYQHETGGWPKNIDLAAPLTKAEITRIREERSDPKKEFGRPTIDNKATHTELRFLARVYDQTGQERFRESFLSGVDYLLAAQYANGGWPQYYPIRKGYYENVTFNDGAMMGVMELLRDVAENRFSFVDTERVEAARAAVDRGIELILRTQIQEEGQSPSAWCAQYHPVTLEPANARAYELVSLSGAESVGIVKFLMEVKEPSPEIVRAVDAAVDWFERVQLRGLRLIRKKDDTLPKGYDLVVGFDPEHATPLWARFYEIGTNYPIFVGRDGIIKYSLSEIEYERRNGYSWLSDWGRELLEEYPKWVARQK